jgi:acetyltransferase-like isoleucine patch superfamily enzyme
MLIKSSSIVSKNTRIRHLEHFSIGEHSIVDDFSYFSTQVKIGNYCHIAPNCTIAGGKDYLFEIGDLSSLSSGVRIYCTTNDYVNGLVCLLTENLKDYEKNLITGDVILGRYTGVGANSVIMPNNQIPEGTVIGALSFVPDNFQFLPWSVYAGTPIRFIKKRNQKQVMETAEKIYKNLT